MSWNVVCPACGHETVLAGGEDTDPGEIVMRRLEGEVVVEIRFTAGVFSDQHLHTCEAADYRPHGPVPWKDHADFPVRDFVARQAGDSVEQIASRVATYARVIEHVAHDVHFASVRPPGKPKPTDASVETFRAVEDLLKRAFDLIDPP